MNKSFSIVALLIFATSGRADEWKWQKPCQPAVRTECEVWFNTLERFSNIRATGNGVTLATTFKSYPESEDQTHAALLVQTDGLNREQLNLLKQALTKLVLDSRATQNLGLYHSGQLLIPLAPLGTPHRDVREKISTLKVEPLTALAGDHPIDLVTQLSAAPSERKVLYWITSGVPLSPEQSSKIQAKLAEAKVRLVAIQLLEPANEVLRTLAETSGGLFKPILADSWVESLAAVAGYSMNGGKITLATDQFCNTVNITFTATNDGHWRQLSQQWEGQYPACARAGTPPSAETDRTARAQQPSAGPGTQETPEAPASGETPSVKQTPSQEPGPGGPAGGAPPDPGWGKFAIPLAAGLGIIGLVALSVWLLRRRAQVFPAASAVSDAFVYGFLVEHGSTGEMRHPLSGNSIKIGRDEDCTIVLYDDAVSSQHALIIRNSDGETVIIDLDSSNGVSVNGKPIDRTVLKTGDLIQLGETMMRYDAAR